MAGDKSVAEESTRSRRRRVPARMRGALFSAVVATMILAVFAIGPSVLPRSGPPATQLMSKMSRALRGPRGRSATFDGQLTISGTTSVSQDSFSTSVPVSGRFSGSDIEVDATIPADGMVGAIRTGPGFYLRTPGSGWTFFPAGPTSQIVTGQTPTGNPADLLGELLKRVADAGGQTFEGPSIDGVSTYEVRPLFLSSSADGTDPVDSILSNAKASIYTGRDDGLPRRIELSLPLDAGDLGSAGTAFGSFARSATIDLDLDFSGWGSSAGVRAPQKAKDAGPAIKKIVNDGEGAEEIPSLIGWPW